MQFDHFPKRIAGLLTSLDELFVSGKILMDSLRVWPVYHLASSLLQPVPQLNIFHAVNRKLFVKTPSIMEYGARGGNVTGVIVGKIHRPAGNAVGIENFVVAKVTEKGIGGIAPWCDDTADN